MKDRPEIGLNYTLIATYCHMYCHHYRIFIFLCSKIHQWIFVFPGEGLKFPLNELHRKLFSFVFIWQNNSSFKNFNSLTTPTPSHESLIAFVSNIHYYCLSCFWKMTHGNIPKTDISLIMMHIAETIFPDK